MLFKALSRVHTARLPEIERFMIFRVPRGSSDAIKCHCAIFMEPRSHCVHRYDYLFSLLIPPLSPIPMSRKLNHCASPSCPPVDCNTDTGGNDIHNVEKAGPEPNSVDDVFPEGGGRAWMTVTGAYV